MTPTFPLPLHHSWPLFERGQRFDLGHTFQPEARGFLDMVRPVETRALARAGIGRWSCDLNDNSLTWSDEVYAFFGQRPGTPARRAASVSLYRDESRVVMERLRAYAIKHRRGFTVDVEIRPDGGDYRWIRLTAAPICDKDRVVMLHGLKQDVSAEYARQAVAVRAGR
ncbi:PAS domain-containing protein [Sphingomonas naphthae]|uniref:PAS domain-containing protein n=1 Tax=Sphingomonas naphthae TaxID=1813468 RepID=A0ABY7TFU1_9SPHN|nr:PAS domain-containing protein [Sphingomonas naphthae]WCT71923.1 PAS domain-containing protein [Sphingomonas naphthae]